MSRPGDDIRRRRRAGVWLAALGAVVAVIVGIAVGTTVVSRHNSASSSDASWLQPAALVIPAGSHLIPYRATDVVSPISIGAPAMNALDWTSTPDSLVVQWDVQGIVQSAMTSSDKRPFSTPTVATAGRGYVVDALARSATSNTPITVGGHPAVLSSGAPPADSGILAGRWISWQLPGGRYVHAWSAGPDDLMAFAGGLAERDQVLPRRINLALTLPGLTAESGRHSNVPAGLVLDGLNLCPTSQSPQDESSAASEKCINITITHGPEVDRAVAVMASGGKYVTVAGLKIYAAGNEAYVRVDNDQGSFGINVWSPDRTPEDLALIAASVRFDPGMAAGI